MKKMHIIRGNKDIPNFKDGISLNAEPECIDIACKYDHHATKVTVEMLKTN